MFLKGSKSSRDAKGWGLTAGLAMAGAEENVLIPNGSSFNPELVLEFRKVGWLKNSGNTKLGFCFDTLPPFALLKSSPLS